jgi:hypothetical protein
MNPSSEEELEQAEKQEQNTVHEDESGVFLR